MLFEGIVMFSYCPNCCSPKIYSNNGLEFICPSCNFNYFHNMAASVAALITFEDEVLFTVREKSPGAGLLDLPGGFVDHRESLEKALSREVFEELGFHVDTSAWKYFCSQPNVYQYNDMTYHTCDSVFITSVNSKPELTLEKKEISNALWLKKDTIDITQVAFDSLRSALGDFIVLK